MSNEKMRASFEAWYADSSMPNESDWFRLDADGDYDMPHTQTGWDAWQAALAQQSEPETAKAKWNATADEHNQWDELGQDEKDELESAQVSQEEITQAHYLERLQTLNAENADLKLRVAELEAATEHLGLTPQQAKDGLARYKASVAERDKLQKDAARWDYVMQTTTAIHDAGQVLTCTPEEYKAAVDLAMEQSK